MSGRRRAAGVPYGSDYYAGFRVTGRASANVIAPLLVAASTPASVVDVGCGEGYFLDAFREHGISDTLGVDGPFNDGAVVRAAGHGFRNVDLQGGPLALGRRFDLVVCLEVAEHLKPRFAEELVAGLTSAGPAIVFSAAVPGQGGDGHVNEQPQSYWAEIFAAHGFWPSDVVRPETWADDRVSWWYRQNLLVYRQDGERTPLLLDVVHPEFLHHSVERERSGKNALRSTFAAIARHLPSRGSFERPT